MRTNVEWLAKQRTNEETGEPETDGYVLGILDWGEKILDLIDDVPEGEPLDAQALVHQADRDLELHGTGNMAAYAALIATKCSSRGEEFRVSWNKANGKPESKGVVNPAIITIG